MNGASPTVVDRLHLDFAGLLRVLDEAGEVSLRSVAEENFRKSLMLAAASYFERRMTESVLTFVEDATNRNALGLRCRSAGKTTKEIHALYRRALLFVESVPAALRDFDSGAT